MNQPSRTLAGSLTITLAILGILPPASAQNSVISTVAGSDFVFRGDGGLATQAQLSQMSHAITDSDGNVLVADRSNHQVLKIAPNGILTVIAGNGISGYSGDGGPATKASLSYPAALALDKVGNLYIADLGNNRIRFLGPDGVISAIAGNGVRSSAGDGELAINASILEVYGLAIDSAGSIYFTEYSGHRVRQITTDGVVRTYAGNGTAGFGGDDGPATQASLRNPWHLAFDNTGNLLIADFLNRRVRRITPAGVITTVAGNGASGWTVDGGLATGAAIDVPTGLFVDAANNLYISSFNHRVCIVSPSGLIRAVAGTAAPGFSGDGGAVTKAELNQLTAVTGDAAGNIFIIDAGNLRIRRVTPEGIISTYAGTGQNRYSGDGGQAVAAAIGNAYGLAVDPSSNIYLSDVVNHRIRKVSPNGIISTYAGTGLAGFSGDDGPSSQAALNGPRDLATDSGGNLYVTDSGNRRVRRIAPSGVITTVAGGAEVIQRPADGQQATRASIFPSSLAVGRPGNLFIFDSIGCVVFRVTPSGALFRYAGRYGECGSSGDGEPAINATIAPEGRGSIGVDNVGNLYITEYATTTRGRVRRVGLDGKIQTVAGGVPLTRRPFDGESALTAPLLSPTGVFAGDPGGAFFIADGPNIFVVTPDGRIARLAGESWAACRGDGEPARNTQLIPVGAMTLDQHGNLLFVDLDRITTSFRVRAILADPPSLTADPDSLEFRSESGGAPPPPQNISVTASIAGVGFTNQVTTANGRPWLRAVPTRGASPRLVEVTADPADLAPGTYRGTITIDSPFAVPLQRTTSVTFEVVAGQPPRLDLDNQNFSFAFPLNAASRTQTLTVRNTGGGGLDFTATAAINNRGDWLTLSPASGQALPAAPATVTVTASPGNLPPGTYTGRITLSTATETRSLPLTITINANERAILLSQSGLSFTAVAGGGIVPPRTFEVLNIGRGVVAWNVSTTTLAGGPGWLSATPGNGSTDAAARTVPGVEIRVNQAGLAPGNYYGVVRVDAPGAANSPHVITVFLDVLPEGSDPGPLVEPAELVFTGVAGRSSPGSKEVFVYNIAAVAKTFRSTTTLPGPDTAAGASLVNLPSDLTLAVDQPNRVIVQPFIGNLPPGVYQSGVNLQFSDGRVRTVRVQVILTAPDAPKAPGTLRFATACTPTKLVPAITSLASAVPVAVGWPVPITTEVRDDCGGIHDSGSVGVSFSNGDPPISLQPLKDGRWTGTWAARGAANTTTLKLDAVNVTLQIRGALTLSVDSRTRYEPPVVESGGVVSAVGVQPFVPVAPGGIISIFGERLADVTQDATTRQLPKQIGSTSVLMGGLELPLLSVSAGRIDAIVPVGLAPNTPHQLLVQRASAISRPVTLDVAPAQPAVVVDASVSARQGRVTWVRPESGETALARPETPTRAGDLLVIDATGLGITDPVIADGVPAPDSPAAQTRDAVTVLLEGVPVSVESAGLEPGQVGRYQVKARVPQGAPRGEQVSLVLVVSGQSSQPVAIAVQ